VASVGPSIKHDYVIAQSVNRSLTIEFQLWEKNILGFKLIFNNKNNPTFNIFLTLGLEIMKLPPKHCTHLSNF
jgi:hypothetical protein